jgi:hypothetical protein
MLLVNIYSALQFIFIPLLATSAAYLIGFGKIDDGLPLKVVMILSSSVFYPGSNLNMRNRNQ